MRNLLIILLPAFSNSSHAQDIRSMYDCFFPVIDSMGMPKYIVMSDKEKIMALKDGERVKAFSEYLEPIGYYRRGKNGNLELVLSRP